MITHTPNMTDYERARRSFTLPVPEYFNFAVDVIDRFARDERKHAMLWTNAEGGRKEFTIAHFRDASSRVAT